MLKRDIAILKSRRPFSQRLTAHFLAGMGGVWKWGASLYGPFTFVYRFSLCTLAQPLEVRQFYHYYRPSSCRKVFNSFWEKGQGVSIWPLPVPIQTWSLGDNPLALALHTGTLTALAPPRHVQTCSLGPYRKGTPPPTSIPHPYQLENGQLASDWKALILQWKMREF